MTSLGGRQEWMRYVHLSRLLLIIPWLICTKISWERNVTLRVRQVTKYKHSKSVWIGSIHGQVIKSLTSNSLYRIVNVIKCGFFDPMMDEFIIEFWRLICWCEWQHPCWWSGWSISSLGCGHTDFDVVLRCDQYDRILRYNQRSCVNSNT